MSEPIRIDRADVEALTQAFVARMKWPSLHWSTQHLDHDAAYALAALALEHGPNILATARIRERAIADAMSEPVEVTA